MTAGAAIFAALAGVVVLFHAAVILGAPWGRFTMGGRWPGVLPPEARVLSALSALLMVVMGAVLWWGGPGWAVWTVVGLTFLSVLANAVTPSRAERRLWLPVTVVMALAALSVAL